MRLNEMIKAARLKKGMTQLDLAKLLNYDSTQFIHLMEIGRSKVPNKVLGRLCKILDLPADKIIKQKVAEYAAKLREEMNS